MEQSVCVSVMWLSVVIVQAVLAQGPVVSTALGDIRGNKNTYTDGRPYESFLGIPYGASMAGERRWTVPDSAPAWDGVYDATDFKPYCKQLITPAYFLIGLKTEDSEDCLFLNVYVPHGVDGLGGRKLPVIFFIMGGAFLVGASDMYPMEDLALNGDVIIVTSNYRVATLGFASTEDENAPGNFGLWDQVLTLRWINENIEQFGGDVSRITVMGHSAGAAMTSHLAASPVAKGLFQRIITISGSSTAYFGYSTYVRQSVRNMATLFLCNIFNDAAMMQCLREKNATMLDVYGLAGPIVLGNTVPNWVPTLDGTLVPDQPRTLLEQGAISDVDILVGSTRHDAASFIYLNFLGYPIDDLLNLAANKNLMLTLLRFMMIPYGNTDVLVDAILAKYPDLSSDDYENRTRAAVHALTDFLFGSQAHLQATLHSKNKGKSEKGTYLYEFAYDQSFLFYADWLAGAHLDDIHSILGEVFLKVYRQNLLATEWNDDDRLLSRYIQRYYANFAYTGNPNEGPHEVPVIWPAYNNQTRQYLVQQLDVTVAEQSPDLLDKYNFWNEEFYALTQQKHVLGVTMHPDVARFTGQLHSHLVDLIDNFGTFKEDPAKFISVITKALRGMITTF